MTAKVPERNQRLYRCWSGELHTVMFREQSIQQGAYVESWTVFDPKRNQRILCSVGGYYTTEKEAWRAELKSQRQGLKYKRLALAKAKQEVVEAKAMIVRMKNNIAAKTE